MMMTMIRFHDDDDDDLDDGPKKGNVILPVAIRDCWLKGYKCI